jgi:RNA-directed DNA polymerase
VTTLLKRQRGACPECRLFFKDGDDMKVVHIASRHADGSGVRHYRQLLHRHCQNAKSATKKQQTGWTGAIDKRQVIEEPDESKDSRPVLKPSGGSDPVA